MTVSRLAWTAILLGALGSTPAHAQADIGLDEIPMDLPDLTLLFRARPPMGDCPLGDSGDELQLGQADHLLHLGAARFYLDHRRRIGLNDDQRRALEVLRVRAIEAWSREQARIDAGEVALWNLTGGREPDEAAIGTAVRELESLRADQRIEYVGSVLTASRLLTDEQRSVLVGADAGSH